MLTQLHLMQLHHDSCSCIECAVRQGTGKACRTAVSVRTKQHPAGVSGDGGIRGLPGCCWWLYIDNTASV
jgi:hypothetical protein